MQKSGNKRGQITLFVIVGIIILAVVFTAIMLIPKQGLTPDAETESVPEDFKPAASFVESCLHQVALEGVRQLGAHGGYIEPLNPEINHVNLKYDPVEPTRSELVSFTDEPDDAVPYYLHIPGKSGSFNYYYDTAIPTVEDMEQQLGRYIEREMPLCLGDFAEIEELGYDVQSSDEFGAIAKIYDDMVTAVLDHPIRLEKEGKSLDVETFGTRVHVPLKQFYLTAIVVSLSEYYYQFSESFTLALISYYSGLDPTLLPPIRGFGEDADYEVIWFQDKVNMDLDGLLTSYAPALQVNGTRDYTPIDSTGSDDRSATFLNSLSINLINGTAPDTAVTFFYKPYSLSSRVQPNSGSLIRPSSTVTRISPYIPVSTTYDYKFYYDVAFPLFVEIRFYNLSAETPEFSYIFAIESNLIENKVPLAWEYGHGTIPWDPSRIDVSVTLPDETNQILDPISGDLVTAETVYPQITRVAKSLFCEESTWSSGEVSVTTVDDLGQPLEGVNVGFGCGDFDKCAVGKTATEGVQAMWKGQLPICAGGFLYLFKDGYDSRKIRLSTASGANAWLPTATLSKVRNFTATVKKKPVLKTYTRDDWEWSSSSPTIGAAQDINDAYETVILTMEQVGSNVGDRPLVNSLIVGKNGNAQREIRLVPGQYEISASFIDEEGIIIPHNCSRTCVVSFPVCIGEQKYPEEDIEMNPAAWGGIDFTREEGAGTVTFTSAMLDSGDEIELYILELPDLQLSDPRGACTEALEEMGNIGDYSTRFKASLTPVIR